MTLSANQLERYQRHILLPEIGGQGQKKLLNAKVLVIGAGGLGCPILAYLTAAGIGTISICDADEVSLSNLQRQILFTESDIGELKVTAAINHLTNLNSETNFIAHAQEVNIDNAEELIAKYDLIIEGVDNFAARYVLNAECIKQKKVFISAAIGKFDGQIACFKPWSNEEDGCYQCLVPEAPDEFADCEQYGVIGTVPGIVGSLAAMEVIKEITNFGQSLAGSMLIFNGLTGETRRVKLPRDPQCPHHQ